MIIFAENLTLACWILKVFRNAFRDSRHWTHRLSKWQAYTAACCADNREEQIDAFYATLTVSPKQIPLNWIKRGPRYLGCYNYIACERICASSVRVRGSGLVFMLLACKDFSTNSSVCSGVRP